MKKILLFLLISLMSFAMISCGEKQPTYDVYVTVYPMKFVVEEIFRDTEYTVDIVPGVTSHQSSVDWSPKEIIAMQEARYLFYVGANYDQYIDLQISSLFNEESVDLVKLEDQTDYIQFIQGIVHIHNEENQEEIIDNHSLGLDPHFWVSPLKVLEASHLIYDKLILKFDDPDGVMENNYDSLKNRLLSLSDAYQMIIGNAQKVAMTSTNIFGYLRHDYGFEYFSISPGYHEETEQFTSQEKEEIVNHAIENNIKYIIYEKYTSSPLSNAVFDELEILGLEPEKLEFQILQALNDEDISKGKDYITVMYENLELLTAALNSQLE